MNYISIRTSTIRPSTELPFDVFVLFKGQYLKYKSSAEAFEEATMEKFKNKKIKKLYIESTQETSYLKYLDQALDQLKQKKVSVVAKADLAQDTLKQEAENIHKSLENEASYQASEKRIHKVIDFMLSEPKSLVNMLASAGLSVDDSQHGAVVSSLCLSVGAVSKLVSREEMMDMAVAALLHDTGLKPLGFNARCNLSNISKEDWSKFRTHPQNAIDQVSGKKYITGRVLRIIQDHEEYGEGLGFPEKKWYKNLAADSKIFNLCDAYDHFSILKEKPLNECIEDFIAARADHFDLKIFEILEKQVKV